VPTAQRDFGNAAGIPPIGLIALLLRRSLTSRMLLLRGCRADSSIGDAYLQTTLKQVLPQEPAGKSQITNADKYSFRSPRVYWQ
jgi:hypothetical protein